MNTSGDIVSFARRAEALLRGRIDPHIALSTPRVVSVRERSLVVRCDVSGWGNVASVIIKRNDGDDQRGFTDWASLAFLSMFEDSNTFAPRFYAGDPDKRFLVMEDLGPPLNLETLFANGDVPAITDALRRLGQSMARLVATTYGQETAFARIRETLPGRPALTRQVEAKRWLEAYERVGQWADLLGIQVPPGFEERCVSVAHAYAAPGAFLAFSHGDPAPSNNHITPRRACLIDFEYAAYRHALYDITAWETLCPLPESWMAETRQTFRATLQRTLYDFADEDQFRVAWSMMCAFRAITIVTWMSPDLLEQDQPWVSSWTRRAALISAATRLHRLCSGITPLEPVAEFGERMTKALRSRWPEYGDGSPRLLGTASGGR